MAWIHFWFEWRCVQVERVMLLIFHFLVFPLGGGAPFLWWYIRYVFRVRVHNKVIKRVILYQVANSYTSYLECTM